MNFNEHYNLIGQHAFLSASKYHWINYDEEKLINVYSKHQATQRGIELHELASQCITLGVRLPKTNNILNLYVNDAIGYKMKTEQVLYYSDNCFGTTDTISFRKNILRIHDLKTGQTPGSIKQLLVYAALFCLEYRVKPIDIKIELRLYQGSEVLVYIPEAEEVYNIVNKIVAFDKKIEELKKGGRLYE
jgi:hypothetical protein